MNFSKVKRSIALLLNIDLAAIHLNIETMRYCRPIVERHQRFCPDVVESEENFL